MCPHIHYVGEAFGVSLRLTLATLSILSHFAYSIALMVF